MLNLHPAYPSWRQIAIVFLISSTLFIVGCDDNKSGQ